MSLNSDLLLSFLARPRTLEEVARHLGIPSSEAERLVINAVESGQVFVSSQRGGGGRRLARPPRTSRTSLESNSSIGSGGVLGRGLARFGNSRVPTKMRVERGNTFFKLRPDKSNRIRRATVHLPASEILGHRKTTARGNSRMSLSEEIRLLEKLSPEPRSLDELRATLGVSRDIVERFVRNGLLRCDWGTNGVGNFYKITSLGLAELRRLKTASSFDSSILRKGLISLKRMVPQLLG